MSTEKTLHQELVERGERDREEMRKHLAQLRARPEDDIFARLDRCCAADPILANQQALVLAHPKWLDRRFNVPRIPVFEGEMPRPADVMAPLAPRGGTLAPIDGAFWTLRSVIFEMLALHAPNLEKHARKLSRFAILSTATSDADAPRDCLRLAFIRDGKWTWSDVLDREEEERSAQLLAHRAELAAQREAEVDRVVAEMVKRRTAAIAALATDKTRLATLVFDLARAAGLVDEDGKRT